MTKAEHCDIIYTSKARAEHLKGKLMVNKVAFINGKGGCGKTTSIFHVSGVLSKMGEKVLVVDLDKQRNSSDVLLMNSDYPEKTVFDVFNGASLKEAIAKALFQTRANAKPKYYNVDCLVSDTRLEDEKALANVDRKSFAERFEAFVKKQGYTWVLVDMPPSNKELNEICFGYIADNVIVPFSSDIFSVNGYGDIMNVLDKARTDNPLLSILGVYLSRYTKNSAIDNYIKEQLGSFDTFIDVQIPLATDIRESVMFGRPISFYKEKSNSRTAYEKLVNEMVLRLSKK